MDNKNLGRTLSEPHKEELYYDGDTAAPSWFGVPQPSVLSLEEKMRICESMRMEIVVLNELEKLFKYKQNPICYDGFEPSGRMHLAQAVSKAHYVNNLTKCGCVFVFWVADWFAQMNNKMGGDMTKIRKVGKYFEAVWKAADMNMENVRFLWASEEISKHGKEYMERVVDISRNTTIRRLKRCVSIMGREETDDGQASNFLYPLMQCSDIFLLKADICQLGLDQRKVNMLAREYCDASNTKKKPVIMSHEMLPGLKEGQSKMSKSSVDSAIFVDDSDESVKSKISMAYCPPKIAENNPCLIYMKTLVLDKYGSVEIERRDDTTLHFDNASDLQDKYVNGDIHPADLKAALVKYLVMIVSKIRKHFESDPELQKLKEEVASFRITR